MSDSPIPLEKLRPGETWKARAADLTERFTTAQAYIARLRRITFEAATNRLRFICRTHGEYPADFGSFWYSSPSDGSILQVNYSDEEISLYASWRKVLALYSTFQAEHNVESYKILRAAAPPEVVAEFDRGIDATTAPQSSSTGGKTEEI